MTALAGVIVRGPIVPADSADVYPTHDAQYGKGGFVATPTATTMLAIPAERRAEGMMIYVIDVAEFWQFRGGIADTDLVQLDIGVVP